MEIRHRPNWEDSTQTETPLTAGEDFGRGKRARSKGHLRAAQRSVSHTARWTAAFLRAKFDWFVPSRSQKVTLAGKAPDRPSHFSGDLSPWPLRRSLVEKICRVGAQVIIPRRAPGLRHFHQSFSPQQPRRSPSFSRKVAKDTSGDIDTSSPPLEGDFCNQLGLNISLGCDHRETRWILVKPWCF